MKKAEHKRVVELVRETTDKAGKEIATKSLKGISVKEILQSKNTTTKKFLSNVIKVSKEKFQAMNKVGKEFAQHKIDDFNGTV